MGWNWLRLVNWDLPMKRTRPKCHQIIYIHSKRKNHFKAVFTPNRITSILQKCRKSSIECIFITFHINIMTYNLERHKWKKIFCFKNKANKMIQKGKPNGKEWQNALSTNRTYAQWNQEFICRNHPITMHPSGVCRILKYFQW